MLPNLTNPPISLSQMRLADPSNPADQALARQIEKALASPALDKNRLQSSLETPSLENQVTQKTQDFIRQEIDKGITGRYEDEYSIYETAILPNKVYAGGIQDPWSVTYQTTIYRKNAPNPDAPPIVITGTLPGGRKLEPFLTQRKENIQIWAQEAKAKKLDFFQSSQYMTERLEQYDKESGYTAYREFLNWVSRNGIDTRA